ncbi:MAG TPA: serine/threonine-protein kinase [Anaerolineales bacterium]|nr:serine/threonine-protein kinase [Anaerolineales bacterium]
MDRYEIQEVVGVGGMGTVYRARDKNFKAIRLVAVKEMISQITDPLVRKKIYLNYERESNILATLRHQSIPRIYDYFIRNDRVYLIMEFVNGRNLDEILADVNSFFPESQVISWGIELCDVLHYLHSNKPEPIIFRDIKPSNIMITPQNHIMLVDFGIAKLFAPNEKNTMIGTQGYSPPDQYRGEATPKVDIYALGATLHHLLTLRDPRLEAPFSFNERPIQEINNSVTDELVAVINRALEYNPEDRFTDAEDMKDALITAGRKTGTLPDHMVPLSNASSSLRGSVKPLWTFECEDEIRGTPLFHNSNLYIPCYDNNLYALDASNGSFIWKYATDGGLPGKPAVYDNSLYIGSEDHRLHAVSVRSGSLLWTYFAERPFRSSPTIAQGHIFIGSDDSYLHAVNMATGRVAWKMDAAGAIRSTPLVSQDKVYFGTEEGELICLDFSGDTKWRFRTKRAVTSSPALANDIVYFASLDSTLYALDANTGWAHWRFRLGRGSISSPLIVENNLYIGAADHVVYCIHAQTSKELWRYTTEHQITASPTFYKDSIYIGSVDGHMYCLDANSGQLKWKFSTPSPITGTAVANEDMIYFGSTDHIVYALLA